MANNTFITTIRNLIAQNNLDEAIKQLRTLVAHSPKLDGVLLQSARLQDIRKHIRQGTATWSEINLTQDQIRAGLVDLVREIENQDGNPEVKAEVEKAVSIINSKNVVTGSNITAGGNIIIGDGNTTQHADKIYNIQHAVLEEVQNRPPRFLTSPPFNPDYFIGRDKDLEAIEAEYQQNYRLLMLVNGEGGIGKTTLAAKYWYQHEDRYRHLAWLYSDQGIGTALLSLAGKLGLQFAPEADEAAQIEWITEALNNLDKPCLLVFDNANNAVDLEAHYVRLNRLTDCHILLTSRVKRLQEMKVYEVSHLDKEDAVALFRKYYPKLTIGEEPLLHDILHAVGYNTLVTEVLAKNLAAFNRFSIQYSLEGLLAELQEKGLLALRNKAVKVAYGSNTLRTAEPSEIIGAMYDLAQLSETERHLLSNLAVLPAENIPYDLLKTLLEAGDKTIDDVLTGLEEKGWLDFREEDASFKISPVIQEITRNKNAERLLTDCHALIQSLQSGLDGENRHKDNYQTASLLARWGETVIQAIPIPDDDVATLCQNIGDYHKDTGNLSLMMKAYQRMENIFSSLNEAYPQNVVFKNNLAISYSKLGSTHTSLGNLQQALTFFDQRSRLGKELYEAYPQNVVFKNNLAISYSKLGSTHTSLGNLQQALTFFEESNQLIKELYEAYPQNVEFKNGLAISYEKLGSTHTSLGNLQQALTFFEESNQLIKELYEAYPQNVEFKNGLAISYEKLGSTHTPLGNLQQALTFFDQRSRLGKELYEAYPQNVAFKNGLAISYEKLGSTHTSLGNLQQALIFFDQRYQLSKELYEAYPQNVEFKNGLAISYEKLGSTHTSLGNLQQALTFFDQRYQLSKELYEAYPQNVEFKNGLAISFVKLAQISLAKVDLASPKKYLLEAEKHFSELHEISPQNSTFKQYLEIVRQALESLK